MLKNKLHIKLLSDFYLAPVKLKNLFIEHANESEYLFIPLAILGFIGYTSYYIIWREIIPTAYESMPLRLIAIMLCAILMFKNYWPKKLRSFLPAYWYLTLLYIFPFFYTFMLLQNNFSSIWLQNSMTGLFFLIILLNWLELILIFLLGIALGFTCYLLTTGPVHLPNGFIANIFAYIAPIGIAGVFFYGKEQRQKEKIDSMKLLSANMAHELRTPLAAINASTSGVQEYLPDLIQTYELAQKENLSVPHIRPSQFKTLSSALEHIQAETNFAQTVINMLLVNVDQSRIKASQIESCSIAHCINEALARYPFLPKEKELVHWENNGDFIFQGDELLIIHVLFNLLKNALFYVKAAQKGDIHIWVESGTKYNKLHFRDTGTGIAADILPYIFDRFFSRTYHGSGVGLAFCKMVMQVYGGNISCDSIAGEYAEFILSFPIQMSKSSSTHH